MAYSTIPVVQVKEKIDVNEKETQIFDVLLEVARHCNPKPVLRVAGGWVRDKLLGNESSDIDIALDNMLGRDFCEKINEYYLSSSSSSHTTTTTKSLIHHVIHSNPNKSKHLETANMRLLDVSIDFVNLRSEKYNDNNSRIPTTMEFGNLKEDARRRDLTINSLFYNIHTNSVEDPTERGLTHLKSGKIVTPASPMETFLDDPLRVLRAIRFGARFGFVLDQELKQAAASDQVRGAIADKISRERIGHEIDLMVSGYRPVQAMTYICDLQLFWVVFSLPPEPWPGPALPEGCDDRLCISYMVAAWDIGCEIFDDDDDDDDIQKRRLYLYGALFLPLSLSVYKDNKDKKIPLVKHIFGKSLKLKSNDAEMVISLHSAARRFKSLIPVISSNVDVEAEYDSGREESLEDWVPVSSRPRVWAGLLLKDIKGYWHVALLMCTLLLYPPSPSFDPCTEASDLDRRGAALSIVLKKRRDLFRKIENTIMELRLDNVWKMKPLVNGKELMSILELKTGGPEVKRWQDRLTIWQLAYPSGTTEEFLDWMDEAMRVTCAVH